MANIASQEKRNRQNVVRRERNKTVRSNVKTHLRRFRQAAASGDQATATEAYRAAARRLDKAAQKGIVHRNYAANKKAKMAKALSEL